MLLIRQAIASLCALFTCVVAASGQPYPNRIIKLIVPYPPGGVVDITGRLLADHLQRELNATIVVENKVGASGTLAANFVAKAEPDGYTILFSGAATHAFAPALFKTLPYNPIAHFVPITQVSEGPLGLTVAANSGIEDLAGFITTMKEKGGTSNYQGIWLRHRSFGLVRPVCARQKPSQHRRPDRCGSLPHRKRSRFQGEAARARRRGSCRGTGQLPGPPEERTR
jgi:tripartite-type tricarboxylate transporter receptor subunit TctC